jgi:hypothetical protein
VSLFVLSPDIDGRDEGETTYCVLFRIQKFIQKKQKYQQLVFLRVCRLYVLSDLT